jgi:hypothetical protein
LRQTAVDAVIGGLKRAGVSVVCYRPDSLFRELYPALDSDLDLRTVRVTNEGEGAAVCGGVFLSGQRAALRTPSRIVRDEDQIERAITDAYAWSYASYHHSAVILGGELVR